MALKIAAPMLTLGVFAAIFDGDGRILCVRMNYATHAWTTPGGRVEPGESPLAALEREVLEESGLVVVADGLVGVYSKPHNNDLCCSCGLACCAIIRGSQTARSPSWVTLPATSYPSPWVSACAPG